MSQVEKMTGVKMTEDGQGGSKFNSNLWLLYVICVTGNTVTGMVIAYSAILIYQLKQEEALSIEDASLIATLAMVGQFLSSGFVGFLCNKYGRRRMMIICSCPLFLGWAMIGFSQGHFGIILAGRFLTGFSMMTTVWQVYLTEVAPIHLKGVFGSSGPMGVSFGILNTYILGYIMPWQYVSLVAAGLNFIVIVLLIFWMPESPFWLFNQDREDESRQVLQWLRGANVKVDSDIEDLRKARSSATNLTFKEILRDLKNPGSNRPFILLIIMCFLCLASGGNAILFYVVGLFSEVGFKSNPYLPSILVGFVRCLANLAGVISVRHAGRRPMIFYTAMVMAVSMGLLALNVWAKNHFSSSVGPWSNYMTLLGLCVFVVAYGIGVGLLPFLLMGEMCPIQIRGFTCGVGNTAAYFGIFVSAQTFPYMMAYLGQAWTFGIYSIWALAIALFTHLFLKETRGKSQEEIKDMYTLEKNLAPKDIEV